MSTLAEVARRAIKAFHGSPHDFNKFDISKIGTGEGAQVYGHGLYFAENEATAKAYKEALSHDKDFLVEGGGRLPPWLGRTLDIAKPQYIDEARTMFQGRIREAEEEAKTSIQPWLYPGKIEGLKEVLNSIERVAGGAAIKPPGHMYEVGIKADPKSFLDWDRPIKEQGWHMDEKITDLLRRSEVSKTEANYIANNKTGQDALQRITKPTYSIRDDPTAPWQASGAKTYDEALAMVGNDKKRAMAVLTPDRLHTAEVMREAGIPGIKYLDQGSRITGDAARVLEKYGTREAALDVANQRLASASTGMGSSPGMRKYWDEIVSQLQKSQTSNYVVNDDSIIDIMRKYALPGMVGAGAVGGAMQPTAQGVKFGADQGG